MLLYTDGLIKRRDTDLDHGLTRLTSAITELHGSTLPHLTDGVLDRIFRPHSHDSADSIDSALESSAEGIRALKVSLVVLLLTAVAQAVVMWLTGSVALLADTVHNFSDAMTAVPLCRCGSRSSSAGGRHRGGTPTATTEPRTSQGCSSSR